MNRARDSLSHRCVDTTQNQICGALGGRALFAFKKEKRMKKYILILLILTQLSGFVACTEKNLEEHTKYSVYDLEVEIKSLRDIYVFDDERHLVFTNDLEIYTVNITTGEKSDLKYQLPPSMVAIKACGDTVGNLYVLAQRNGGDETYYRAIYKFSSDGELQDHTDYQKLGGANLIVDMYAFRDGVVLVFDNGIKILNFENGFAIENDIDYVYDSCMEQTEQMYLYLLLRNDSVPSGCSISKYDVAKNAVVWNTAVQNFMISLCFDYESERVMYTDGMNIYVLDADGKLANETVCGLFNYMSVRSGVKLLSGKSGVYVLKCQDDGQYENYSVMSLAAGKSNAKPGTSDAKKTIITIRGFYPAVQLTDAVKEYEAQNNVQVVFDFYKNSMSFDGDGYTQNTNIMLMSGAVEWDIMLTNNLDYTLYAKKNYFADLYELGAKGLRDSGKYYENIIRASETDGRLYVFPLNLMAAPLCVDAEMWDRMPGEKSWEEILDYFDDNAYSGEYIFAVPTLPIKYMLGATYFGLSMTIDRIMKEEWTGADAVAEIHTHLNIYKRLHDKKYTANESTVRGLVLDKISGGVEPNALKWDLPNVKIVNMPSLTKGQEPAFSLMCGAAIMNTSKNKEEAYKLLKYISEHEDGFGHPLNRELFHAENGQWQDMVFASATAEQRVEIQRLYRELEMANESLVSQVAYDGIGKILGDEAFKMVENNGDTRKTAENIYDRVWAYYNE